MRIKIWTFILLCDIFSFKKIVRLDDAFLVSLIFSTAGQGFPLRPVSHSMSGIFMPIFEGFERFYFKNSISKISRGGGGHTPNPPR